MAILIIVARLLLDSGTQNFSDKYIQTNEVLYEGRVLDWGYAERSISVPVSLPRVGDCRIRMADTDKRWRVVLEHETPRRRILQLVRIRDEDSPITEDVIGTYEVVHFVFPQDIAEVTGRDLTFAWLDRPVVQKLITRRNFPDLAEGIDDAFLHVIAGENRSPFDNQQGVIPLPHMGMLSSIPATSPVTLVDRWGVAAHPITEVSAVYRKLPDEGLFTLVNDSEYTITQDIEPRTIDGIDYFFTFLDFDIQQDDGTEIRVDVDGYFFRGVFENDDYSMPEVQFSPIAPLRNPIDFLINVLYVIIRNDLQTSQFDIESFDRVRNFFEGTVFSPPEDPYYCDGAITEVITARAFLQQFLTNFELDLFQNRYGKIEVSLTYEAQPDRPVFDDTLHLLKGTVVWTLANPTFNQWRYLYDKNFATKEFAAEGVFANEADQLALAVPDSSPIIPHIEEEIVEFPFVRDEWTASRVIGRRAGFLALGSYRVAFSLPMPETYNDLELSKQVGITTVWGPGLTGWVNEEIKITDIVHRFAARVTEIRAIVRTPVEVLPPDACPGITGPLVLDFGDVEVFDNVTDGQMPSYVAYSLADYPGQTSVRFRARVVKSNVAYATEPSFTIKDQSGNLKLTPTLSWTLVPATGNYEAVIDEPVTTLDANTEKLYLHVTKVGLVGNNGVLQILVPQLWPFVVESDQARASIPLLPGTSFDRDGSYLRVGTTYARMTSSSIESARFKKTAGAFSQVDYWEIRLTAGEATGAGTVALMNVNTSLPVDGTEIAIAAGVPGANAEYTVQIPDNAANFTDGHEFEFQGKRPSTPNLNIVHGWLDPKIGSPSEGFFSFADLCAESAENYIRVDVSNCQDILMNRAFTYNVSDWPASAVSYFEATGSSTEFGNATIHLLDTGTQAVPDLTPNNVISVTFPGATSRQRSAAVALTDQHIYTAGPSADPLFDIPAFVLFTITGP